MTYPVICLSILLFASAPKTSLAVEAGTPCATCGHESPEPKPRDFGKLLLESACSLDTELFCAVAQGRANHSSGKIQDFVDETAQSFEKFKTRSSNQNKKPSDLKEENKGQLRSFEGEVEMATEYYIRKLTLLEDDTIEPLVQRIKGLQEAAIRRSIAGPHEKTRMLHDLSGVKYLGYGKNKNELMAWKNRVIDTNTALKIHAKDFEELIKYDVDLSRDVGSFFGSRGTIKSDYCAAEVESKDCGCGNLLGMPKHQQQRASKSQFSPKSEDPMREAIRILASKKSECQLFSKEAHTSSKARYCELSRKLLSQPETKSDFKELLRLKGEHEIWQDQCGAAGLQETAAHISYSEYGASKRGKEQYRRIIICPGYALRANPKDQSDQLNKLTFLIGHELGHENDAQYFRDVFAPTLACIRSRGSNHNEDSADLLGLETMLEHLEKVPPNSSAVAALGDHKVQLASILGEEINPLCNHMEDQRRMKDKFGGMKGIPKIPPQKIMFENDHSDSNIRVRRILSDQNLRKMLGCPSLARSCSMRAE